MKLKTSNKNSVLIISLLIVLVIGLFSIKLLDKKKSKYAELPVEYIQDTPLDLIQISLKEKHYLKLKKKRDKALTVGVLETQDTDYVPATIGFNGKSYKAEIRLKGDWTDHLVGDKWSFRVKLKGDQTIKGMRKFSIHHPKTRGYINEWLYHKAIKKEELFGLRYGFLEGAMHIQKDNKDFHPSKNLGVYAIEETFDKRTIESNKRKESIILKFSEDLWWNEVKKSIEVGAEHGYHWNKFMNNQLQLQDEMHITVFGENKVLADPTMNGYFKLSKNLLEALRSKETTIDKVFDVKELAMQNAILNLFGAVHGTYIINLRFYYNPINSKLEPIAFDGNSGVKLNKYAHFLFLNQQKDSIYLKELAYALEKVSKPEFVDRLVQEHAKEMEVYQEILKKEFGYKGLAIHNLRYNQDIMRAELIRLKNEYNIDDINIETKVVDKEVILPNFENWNKKNIAVKKQNQKFKNKEVYDISRLKLDESAFCSLGRIETNFNKKYTVSVLVKASENNTSFGLRMQNVYPNRADAVFNLKNGTVKGAKSNGNISEANATIKPIGNGWYKCSLSAITKGGRLNVILGPTESGRPILSWEGRVESQSSVQIIPSSVEIEESN